ncbi:MAG: hypothetical protein GY928_03345 [Colwellia sp.]|nr:hypothetical protein [Colwellia sp.]
MEWQYLTKNSTDSIIYYAIIAIFFVIATDAVISNIAIATAIATIDTIVECIVIECDL